MFLSTAVFTCDCSARTIRGRHPALDPANAPRGEGFLKEKSAYTENIADYINEIERFSLINMWIGMIFAYFIKITNYYEIPYRRCYLFYS